MNTEPSDISRPWWPFSANELQAGLGLYGFLATTLAFSGMESRVLAWASLAFALLFYLAGLLVHARRSVSVLRLVQGGGVAGEGYIASFRTARRSLFLIHLDDDPPGVELLALYRSLLAQDIQIRRLVFLRPEAPPSAYSWLVEFGDHKNLQQRVVLLEQAQAFRFSFAVVDNRIAILSVPGWDAIDGRPYATTLVLRNLLVLRESTVAVAFLQMHEDLWEHARPLSSVLELEDRDALMQSLLQKRGVA